MKKVTFLLAAILVLGVANIAKAQNNGNANGNGNSTVQPTSASHGLNIEIPSHAMIGLEGVNDIDFTASAPENVGDKMVFSQQSEELWLNYSAIVAESSAKKITATIDDLPSGLVIEVEVGNAAQNGVGATGAGSTQILTTGGVDVVSGIGTCYTGSGTGNGHSLVYTVSTDQDSYGSIVAGSPNLTVTYTITDVN